MKNELTELKQRLLELGYLDSTIALLQWDSNVHMPPKGSDARAAVIAYLSGRLHQQFVQIDNDGLLSKLIKAVTKKEIKGRNAVIVTETWKKFEREQKVPEQLVKDLAETSAKAVDVWVQARKSNDFNLFLPWLEKTIELKRTYAAAVGYKSSPYDALLDQYEPGATTEEITKVLSDLREFLAPFVARIKTSSVKIDAQITDGNFPIDQQTVFNKELSQEIGFDMETGRVEVSTHPFTNSFHPTDVRFTTRYQESNLLYSLYPTLHEAGHGMYEQGLPHEHYATPLAEYISLGVHESQSRMWENLIGRSKPFIKYLHSKLTKKFPEPFKTLTADAIYQAVNNVTPSLIRVTADEVTYNLHIIVRFEIEKELIEGSLAPKDVPAVWKAKMKEYLGIDVPDDTNGALQDTHWALGLVGYFPTYTLGNLYASQLFAIMSKDIPNIDTHIEKGNFLIIRDWLREKVHKHGKQYSADKLIRKISGEPLNSRYYCEYLEKKYSKLYKL